MKLFSLKGRAGRKEYFLKIYVPGLIITIIKMNNFKELNPFYESDQNYLLYAFYLLLFISLLLEISAITRRFRDLRMSQYWWFAVPIPIVNIFLNFVLLLSPGKARKKKIEID